MKITVIAGAELAGECIHRWRALQAMRPELASPYFCPEFTQAVASVRRDVFVGIVEDAGQIAGFFPFQKNRFGLGKPVGGPLSDFYGIISSPDFRCDAEALLRGCGLTSLVFHHLLPTPGVFDKYYASVEDSHYIDLSNGFDAYVAEIRGSGSHLVKDTFSKQRKLAREHGTVRFEAHTTATSALQRLFSWKSNQYRQAGLVDVFSFPWTVALLERIHGIQTPEFGGMLSTLSVNDRLIAVHMGMRSREVWNWWFPRHDEEFSRYSPGILLRILAAQSAPGFGIHRIDLGQGGPETYKPRLRTGGIPLATGRIELPAMVNTLRRIRRDAEACVRRSPLFPIVRWPGRVFKRLERCAYFK